MLLCFFLTACCPLCAVLFWPPPLPHPPSPQVEYVKGWGKFVGPSEVEVALADGSTRTLKAKNIIIATGSEVTPLPGVPIDEER